ncbi:MAG: TSUP family transporter, partial [Candidatus Puniceispirillaceae bacterium]
MNFAPFLASLDVTNPALFLALAFCAALTTAISKAGFGGAVAIGIPILLLVTTPRIALGVTLPILLVIDVWVLCAMRDKINRQLLVIMTVFGMAGHAIGWAFFDYISNDVLTAFIGGMSVFTTILFFKRHFTPASQSATAQYPS